MTRAGKKVVHDSFRPTRQSDIRVLRSDSGYQHSDLKTKATDSQSIQKTDSTLQTVSGTTTKRSRLSLQSSSSTETSPLEEMASSSGTCKHITVEVKDPQKSDDTVDNSKENPEHLSPKVLQKNAYNKLISCDELPISTSDELFIDRPKRPQYLSLDKRMQTFKYWPSSHFLKPEELAKSGWLYEGYEDKVRCFHCGGGLFSWQPNDDPLREHRRWFPKCGFLRRLNLKEETTQSPVYII